MKLVDSSGNEITSKENKEAKELEKQLSKKSEELIEPILNKIKLSGSQLPQEQLMQLVSMAHSSLFNRLIYNLIIKAGYTDINDLLTEDDVEELKTNLSNQIRMVDPNEMKQQMDAAQNPKGGGSN
ncbi:MAG: hypothetical protein ACQETE_11215 [Bacteroidota bacterium]